MDWSATATIAAVILTAIFAGISYLVRINREKKRVLCITLYNLLEIWHQIRVSFLVNPKEIINIYLKEIKSQAPELEITENDREIIKYIYTKMWPSLLSTVGENKNLSIEEEFNNSIAELAAFDPILAYELSANQALKSLISILDNYFKQIEEASRNNTNDSGVEEADLVFNKMRVYLYKDVLKGLEYDLLWLSFQISTPMFIRTIYKIIKKRILGLRETKKMIKILVSRTIVASMKSSNK